MSKAVCPPQVGTDVVEVLLGYLSVYDIMLLMCLGQPAHCSSRPKRHILATVIDYLLQACFASSDNNDAASCLESTCDISLVRSKVKLSPSFCCAFAESDDTHSG